MKEKLSPSLRQPEVFFLSLGGIGFSPIAPGTLGTLAVLPLLYVLGGFAPPFWILLPFIIIFTLLSCYISDFAQKKFGLRDPSWVVVDEAAGIFIAWLFVLSDDLLSLTLVTVLFRAFDIVKVWPAGYFDKKIHSGVGVILDDVISGLYAGIIFTVLKHFFL